jgi:hypothetical protein
MDSYEKLKEKLEKSQKEEWERGKELEKLSALIENWQYQLPEEFLGTCKTVGKVKLSSKKTERR